jgi:hypothetical protein
MVTAFQVGGHYTHNSVIYVFQGIIDGLAAFKCPLASGNPDFRITPEYAARIMSAISVEKPASIPEKADCDVPTLLLGAAICGGLLGLVYGSARHA